ncbi:MAG TPA: pirin family protein, partial [Steroidobacteraceae bacterium]
MLELRRNLDRGYADHGWLKSYHTFSFADSYDPVFEDFGPLRVLNEDRIKPGKGYDNQPHRD